MIRHMIACLAVLLLATGLAATAWAQDADEPAQDVAEDAAEAEAPPTDDSDLDEQSYIDTVDDDFRPSEDIPADQSIAFPTDI